MMKLYKKNLSSALLLVAILLTLNTGCSRIFKQSNDKQGDQSEGEKKSPPKTLTSLENTTEIIISDIQKVEDKRNKKAQEIQEISQENQATESNDFRPGASKDENKSDDKEQTEEGKQEESESIDWSKMQGNVERLQSSWNNYVNMATKDGASNDLIKNYENQLDILTTKVMEKQEESLLATANDLYKYYSKLFDLYKHHAPPNVKDIKYYVRKIVIDSEKGQWSQNMESINSIKEAWEIAKSRMEKPDQDINRKIEAAMDSFSRSVQEQNKHLIKMKGNILINNIDKIK